MTESRIDEDLLDAAGVLAHAGLVSAFGHVSALREDGQLLITPPRPLGSLSPADRAMVIAPEATELPEGTPREAWIHLAIYRARPDVRAICRAQPETATALASADLPIRPLHGQGAFLGTEVPVFPDVALVRDRERAESLATALGASPALLLRGNGAVTVGADLGSAVARMWLLESSARINARAAAGRPRPLTQDEQDAWRVTESELLGRLWTHLRTDYPKGRP
ncbi:class II aldolase/adducin family protein [Crossiella cryophila]|uniref:Ribulose-5-phosphate 4-epimerase/fuculose-1-phosphate aldolase n=1 Tax=Crossiella cryophila TaxID=43355 RepID=A0A7W7CEK1_9PSEU|nr:class II aldolase/adducin family protein [Crossiella cryophila]MBB4679562.1 ribulose-5-phosphate 4-epimerase/fuculose-1-phosphate aldolase [Crossiella cryophila]